MGRRQMPYRESTYWGCEMRRVHEGKAGLNSATAITQRRGLWQLHIGEGGPQTGHHTSPQPDRHTLPVAVGAAVYTCLLPAFCYQLLSAASRCLLGVSGRLICVAGRAEWETGCTYRHAHQHFEPFQVPKNCIPFFSEQKPKHSSGLIFRTLVAAKH